jgi:hypothetical protein
MGRSGLVAEPIVKARTRPGLAPSRFSALVRLEPLIMWQYLRIALKFRSVEIRNPDKILDNIRDFQEGRARLIVAFRHAYGDEPQLLFHVFNSVLPRLAKRSGRKLARRPRVRMVHDYSVPFWGGAFIRFILPRVGAVPVYHVQFDAASLGDIRKILLDGPCPLALAPEGQISYHSETLPRLETGAARIGFWCARDLEKAGRSERMLILPLSIHYRYDPRDAKKINSAVARLEKLCGLPPGPASADASAPAGMLPRLEAVETRALELAEAYYEETCGFRPQTAREGSFGAADRHRRWEALQDAALDAAEQILGIARDGADSVQRMYRIRLTGWGRIYPETPVEGLPPLARAFADRQAGEAWHAMRHMEFVDLMSYHDAGYLQVGQGAAPSFDRLVETVLNLQDLVSRLMGGNISNRPNNIRKRAVLVPGPCVDLTARLPEYRVSAKKAAREAADELAGIFENCIEEYLDGKEC